MKKIVLCLLGGLALRTVSAPAAPPADLWPALQDQLTRDKVVPGSPLERLIRDNQELGTSISDCTVNDDGWFLDDVKVTACPLPEPFSGLYFE